MEIHISDNVPIGTDTAGLGTPFAIKIRVTRKHFNCRDSRVRLFQIDQVSQFHDTAFTCFVLCLFRIY